MRRPLRRRPTAAGSATATAAPRAWLLALALAGCGGPSFDGTVYRGQDVAFRVPAAPTSWRQISVSDAAVAYRDDANGATIALNGRCRNEEDVPLISLTNHLFLHFTEREVLKQEVVPFDGREAMHTVLSAKLDGVPKVFDVWVLKKNGCVYDMLLIADPARYAAGEPAFTRMVRGFSTLPADDD
ncbi:hypothetical protein [Sorangium sp. So ce388]|uniref:Secreted protein n=1 Tax=Sorangium cellulosum TaxID=56 RepID=A0A150SEG1_SORCE|nr:hypothetical protein BE17_27065 [Sorangium cellulosum]